MEITSLEQVEDLLTRFQAAVGPKEPPATFAHNLTQRVDAWFVEFPEVGIVYLTHVVPRVDATLHIVFWDGTYPKERRARIARVLRVAFTKFALPRITCCIHPGVPILASMLRKIGFVLEGTIRRGWIEGQEYKDCIQFGLLPEELNDGNGRG